MKDEDIDFSDIPQVERSEFKKMVIRMPEKKAALSIRLDPGVVAWFRKQGRGYQTRINAVLRSYVEVHSHCMKKDEAESDTMRAEYDFSKGVRGKYAKQYAEGTNVVVLEPDIAHEFPTAESVNHALRSLIHVITSHRKAVVR
jgi:uncharacterized protein (DUF4415 family)